ncbi:MAG: thioredoxin family protein [Gemmataceae bacterium]|nr:thioredoxin family protein [Gemmataceae bacterium]MDW8242597.1 hypothetical protein [Thermogemmata sp.]
MTTATVAILALVGGLASVGNEALPTEPPVFTDYAQALAEAGRTKKPVAVFIGTSAAPLRERFRAPTVPPEVGQLLRERYVVVEISRNNAQGRQWAELFELEEGVVISSPGGQWQAFRHSGPWQLDQLLPRLQQCANAGSPHTTVYSGTVSPTASASTGNCASCSSGSHGSAASCTACSGSASSTTSVVPCSGTASSPVVGSTCSGGTCSTTSAVAPAFGRWGRRSYYVVPSTSCPNGTCYRR